MIDEKALKDMVNGIKSLQDNIFNTMKATYEKMGNEQREQFITTLKNADIEKIAKDNADKVIKLNELFHKK